MMSSLMSSLGQKEGEDGGDGGGGGLQWKCIPDRKMNSFFGALLGEVVCGVEYMGTVEY
jgi:hypothetical protein